MLVIRAEQMSIFTNDAFCRWIVQYLESAYPVQSARIGSKELWQFVGECIGDAKARRLKDASAIRKYVHVAFLLGRDFPARPELDWARRILDSPRYRHEGARLRALEDATAKHLQSARTRA
jgi:hypothetical protein